MFALNIFFLCAAVFTSCGLFLLLLLFLLPQDDINQHMITSTLSYCNQPKPYSRFLANCASLESKESDEDTIGQTVMHARHLWAQEIVGNVDDVKDGICISLYLPDLVDMSVKVKDDRKTLSISAKRRPFTQEELAAEAAELGLAPGDEPKPAQCTMLADFRIDGGSVHVPVVVCWVGLGWLCFSPPLSCPAILL